MLAAFDRTSFSFFLEALTQYRVLALTFASAMQVNAANAAEVENFAEDCKRRFRREMMERMDHDWKDNR